MDALFIKKEIEALTEDCPYLTANLSNAAALLWQELTEIYWVGFYELWGSSLILGPFQGKPACIQIPVGKGVCGTAVSMDRMQRIEDVHSFPGHIACDSASNSEIVIPLHKNGEVWGVLDIDSPVTGRFSEEDGEVLLKISEAIEAFLSRSVK